MAEDTTVNTTGKVLDAMIDVLKNSTSSEMLQAQQILLRRMALEGDVVPSRIPAPGNITEIGGYLNLLEESNQPELRAQVLASVLGVAGPNPPLGWIATEPSLFFTTRANDRPEGALQAAIPVQFTMRSDFASAFDTALQTIHERGCQLPLLSSMRALPSFQGGTPPASELLSYIGRTLDLVPSAALVDPDTDPLVLAHEGTSDRQVVARQLNAVAPKASVVSPANWIPWKCTGTTCQELAAASRTYLPLAPILNAAGWYQPSPLAPQSPSQPGNWRRWTNITGLVAGVTRYGEELGYLYTQAAIVASSLREYLPWVWNGTEFARPN